MFRMVKAPASLLFVFLLALLPGVSAATACSNASNVAGEGGACAQDDETALIQHGLHVKHRQHKAAIAAHSHHARPPTGSLVRKLEGVRRFDCETYPSLCREPFNCHQVSSADINAWMQAGAAYDGMPNYKLWCAVPHYEAYASRCAAGDLDGAGKLQFTLTTSGHFGPLTKEMDASICFIDGQCANTEVTNDTTVEEAAGMCDERFGRQAWATWGSRHTPLEDQLEYGMPTDMSKGYGSAEQTRPSLLAACAMGNYACDVRYCRETYCKEEYYINKYGHFLKEYGWVQ